MNFKQIINCIFIVVLFFIMFNCNIVFGANVNEGEYSEAYKEYIKLSDEEKSKIAVIPRKYNVPIDNIYEKKEELNTLRKTLKGIKKFFVGANEEEEIPESYILTGADTNNDGNIDNNDIKVNNYGGINIKFEDQSPYELCWAFASINTLETNLALHGYGNYDFSELHLDYLDCMSSNTWRTLHSGGNYEIFKDYENRHDGVVMESEVPYDGVYEELDEIEYLKSFKQRANVNEFVDMPTIDKKNNKYYVTTTQQEEITEEILNDFRNSVKKHILKNGALYASIDSGGIKESEGIYYLNSKSNFADHAITIIGWDDNFSKENFPSSCKPEKNGAYIALNTWNGGYIFYISYEDFLVEEDMSGVKDAYITEPLYLSIEHEPNKINYLAGEVFDRSGLVIKANYQDGTSTEIKNYTIDKETLIKGDTDITITYVEGKTTQIIKQKINVFDDIVQIRRKYKCIL